MTKGLWFTDAHIEPDEELSRFDWLGKLIVKEQPDLIVQGGDFVTLDTFSRWDKDKRLKIEGRRYKNDIAAGNAALDKLVSPIWAYNAVQRRFKRKQYFPQWVWFQGNHEYWADEYVMRNPEVEGIIDVKNDLKLKWLPGKVTYIPYRDNSWYYERDGVYFCHVPRNRVGPVSGKYIADKALEVMSGSVIFGHSHRLVSSSLHRAGGAELNVALCGGCFFSDPPDYSIGNNNDYWRGVILFELKGKGQFDWQTIGL